MEYKDLIIPTMNVNDTKVIISDIRKQNLDYIEEGEVLYSVETSKATEEYKADFSGYVVLYVNDMDEVEVGKSAGKIFKSLGDAKIEYEVIKEKASKSNRLTSVNASRKAIAYAEQIGFDITLIKKDGIIKTEDIVNYLATISGNNNSIIRDIANPTPVFTNFDSSVKRVAVIGGGRGTMQILDLISHIDGYKAVRIYEKNKEMEGIEIYGVPVAYEKSKNDIIEEYKSGCFDYVVNGIGGSTQLRKEYYTFLTAADVPYCNLIHPSVVIGQGVKMGSGNIILPLCHIGPEAQIGNDCFMTAKTSIEHHNIIGSHCTFGPGVMFSGSVEVGDCVKFAAGIYAEPLVKIGANSLIASGVVLTKNVPANTIVRYQQNIEFVNKNRFK